MQSQTNIQEAVSVADFLEGVNISLLKHRGRIEGEVTSVKKSYSTAVYFSIKDTEKNALLNCMIWRNAYKQNGIDISEGNRIIVTGTPDIYAPRGSFSLKVQTIEYAGEGELKKAYDDLKKRLSEEGLLDLARKRYLPEFPRKIGVITSRSGVVIQDFNSNLGRYGFKTTMVDSRVEGKDAIHDILAAIETMSKQDIEVLVVMRGGGSWESLQPFNTESVIRKLANFKCPVVTGVGHDTDVTLSELVADVGASTPTAVAEVLNETWDTLVGSIDVAESKILNRYQRWLANSEQSLDTKQGILLRRFDQALSLAHKKHDRASRTTKVAFSNIAEKVTRASNAFQKAVGIMRFRIKSVKLEIESRHGRVVNKFGKAIASKNQELSTTKKHILAEQEQAINSSQQQIALIENNTKRSDPARNLGLGYSLSYAGDKIVRSEKDVAPGDRVKTILADGSFSSEVKNNLN